MKQLITILILSLCIPFTGVSQETMSVEDAIALALKHNYDILLVENSLMQAENNKSIYNTGFLPTVTASANANYSNNNTTLTSQAGQETSIDGAETKSYGGSVGLNYILFNGGARKFQYDKLKNMYDLSDAQKQIQIENTLIDV
jgi:outer membrane protein TolC